MPAPYNNVNALKHGGKLHLEAKNLDGRTKVAKSLKYLRECLISDLGGDISTAQSILIDRVRFKAVRLAFFEQALARGESENFKDYIALSNSMRADLQLLGLERKQRDYQSYLDTIRG